MLLAPDELAAPGVVYRMTGRWREENWFRYGRAHFDLDSLDSYAVTPDDPGPHRAEPGEENRGSRLQGREEGPRRRHGSRRLSGFPCRQDRSPTR